MKKIAALVFGVALAAGLTSSASAHDVSTCRASYYTADRLEQCIEYDG
jgi:hypothetical protein